MTTPQTTIHRSVSWIALVRGMAVLALGTAALASTTRFAWAAERPNVVVMLTDDQGYGDLSASGNTNLRTPAIDSLARDGAWFERFYVCPVCSPTRAEFLTGRYHPRGGVFSTSTGGERLDLDERTIADVFRAAGYATGAFGKWHNGTQYPYHPRGRGFAEFYGFCSGHWGDYFNPPLEHNGQPVTGTGFIADDLTDHALAFIEQHRAEPFFCYVPFNTPHSPMQVPDKYWDRFKNAEIPLRHQGPQIEDPAMTRAALAMVENIDDNVARVLAKLDALRLADNTIVVFFCDNGPNSFRWNAGLKGHKGSTDEGGVRSPLAMRWPGHIPAGTRVTRVASALDLLPTLAELSGVKPEWPKPLDGASLATLLVAARGTAGKDAAARAAWPDRLIFAHWNDAVSVRSQDFLCDASGRLYDLRVDPGQQHDVRAEHPQEAERLAKAAAEWRSTVLAELSKDKRPFTVGYRELPLTNLPARDGVPHGNIERSARAPNCSYFTHWKGTLDRITWDIDVATAGRYEAVIYYTCAEKNVGSTIELGCGANHLVTKITVAHDPAPRGAEHDRVPRNGESLVKDFKPLVLGTIELPAGRDALTLRALEIVGEEVIDVRGVSLRLLD